MIFVSHKRGGIEAIPPEFVNPEPNRPRLFYNKANTKVNDLQQIDLPIRAAHVILFDIQRGNDFSWLFSIKNVHF